MTPLFAAPTQARDEAAEDADGAAPVERRRFELSDGSLQLKLAWVIGPVVVLGLLGLLVTLFIASRQQSEAALRARATAMAELQVRAISQPMWELNLDQVQRLVETLIRNPDFVGARLIDERDRLMHRFGVLTGEDIFTVTLDVPHVLGPNHSKLGQLTVAVSSKSLAEAVTRQLWVAGVALAIGVIGVVAVGYLALRQFIFRPVGLLLNAIQHVERKEWRQVDWSSNDQLGVVSAAFNRMVATLSSNELELRRAVRQVEEAAKAKDEFLASVSHELRTPLNAILGFSEVLKDEMFGPLGSARYRSYAEDIYNSGSHLLNVINDILDLSKVAAGKFELFEKESDLAEIVEASVNLVRERAQRAQLSLSTELDPRLPMLFADELRIKQILINLLTNAVKFTEPGGRVWISAKQRLDGGVDLSVSDTGIGMSADDIPKALSAFGQVEPVLSRTHEGTGLGLPLVKALCDLHGARLHLDSAPKVGTVVTVTFGRDRVRRAPTA